MPLRLDAAILSRTRSPIGSRSNWAKDNSTLSAMGLEQLNELGKISERTGQPVDLVNHHDVNLAASDIGQELLQRGPLERGAGERAIVVVDGDQPPAFVRLTLYMRWRWRRGWGWPAAFGIGLGAAWGTPMYAWVNVCYPYPYY